MPSLTFVTTTAGREKMLEALSAGSSVVVADAQLANVFTDFGEDTNTLTGVVATVTARGSVRSAGDGNALHIVLKDESTASYTVRTIAVRLSDGTFLMGYGQSAAIATKASGSSLHMAFDLTIDAASAAVITFGDTDYDLPAASETAPGIIEIATSSEASAGQDAVRAVTPLLMRSNNPAPYNWSEYAAIGTTETLMGIAPGVLSGAKGWGICGGTGVGGFIGYGLSPNGKWNFLVTSAGLNDILYDPTNAIWVTVGETSGGDALIMTASGLAPHTWTERANPQNVRLNAAAVTLSGRIVAVGDAVGGQGYILRSTNGTSYAQQTCPVNRNLYGICYGKSVLVAVGAGGASLVSGDGGSSWDAFTVSGSPLLLDVCFNGTYFVATSLDGSVFRSEDGEVWESVATLGSGDYLRAIAADPQTGVLVVHSYPDFAFLVSQDHGATFGYAHTPGEPGAAVSASSGWFSSSYLAASGLAFGNGRFAAALDRGHVAFSQRRA